MKKIYKFRGYFHEPGYFDARFGGGPMEEIEPDKDSDIIEKEFYSLAEVDAFIDEYMKTHIVKGAAGGKHWVDDTDISWIEAKEKGIIYAKTLTSYNRYIFTVTENVIDADDNDGIIYYLHIEDGNGKKDIDKYFSILEFAREFAEKYISDHDAENWQDSKSLSYAEIKEKNIEYAKEHKVYPHQRNLCICKIKIEK